MSLRQKSGTVFYNLVSSYIQCLHYSGFLFKISAIIAGVHFDRVEQTLRTTSEPALTPESGRFVLGETAMERFRDG
jgi:hypothetical protein